jgi:hypothetical protein
VVCFISSSGGYINGRNSANLELLIDKTSSIYLYVKLKSLASTLFQQVVGIPMGTNCALRLADLFLYSFESEFLQKFVKDKKSYEARDFNFTYRYIDDVLSINNSRFAEFPVSLQRRKYVIDEELQYTDHLFLEVACFSFLNLEIKKDRHNLTIKEQKDLNFVILLKRNPKNYLRQVLFHLKL